MKNVDTTQRKSLSFSCGRPPPHPIPSHLVAVYEDRLTQTSTARYDHVRLLLFFDSAALGDRPHCQNLVDNNSDQIRPT